MTCEFVASVLYIIFSLLGWCVVLPRENLILFQMFFPLSGPSRTRFSDDLTCRDLVGLKIS